MKSLIKLALLLPLLAAKQVSVPFSTGANRGAAGSNCTSPPSGLTNQWKMWNASNTCNGGSACTNSALMDTALDSAGSNNLSQSGSARPPYVTNAINGLAAASFPNASGDLFSGLVTGGVNGSMNWFAVVKIPAAGAGNGAIVGRENSPGGGFQWRVTGSGHQEIPRNAVNSIATSTSTYTGGQWYALLVQYDGPGTGVWTFYNCSSGTCVADGTGTNGMSFTQVSSSVGYSIGDGSQGGMIAEVSLKLASPTTAGYGAYALACYGI